MRHIRGFNESIKDIEEENIGKIFQRVVKDRIVEHEGARIDTNSKYYIGELESSPIFMYDGNTIVEELIFSKGRIKLALKLIDEDIIISKIKNYIDLNELKISEIEKDILEKENIIQKIKHGGYE